MRHRVILIIALFLIINVSFSSNNANNKTYSEDVDLKAVFDVMFSLDTWGMGHEEELIEEMIAFLANNYENKYSFIISDDLKIRLNWKTLDKYINLENIDRNHFMGWNRRYFEDLLIKYYYNNNKNNIVNDICKTRTFIPEFYIVGPLKKNWNPLLRTQWSYLLDRDLVYNTPFGNKKYEKLINSNYVKDIAETNNNSGSVVNGNDYFSEAYLCAFSVYFKEETDVILKVNNSENDIYINSVSMRSIFVEMGFDRRTLYPIKFSKGRFDFVIQTQDYPGGFNAEFLFFEDLHSKNIDFNKHFNYDYGKWSEISENSNKNHQYSNLTNYVYSKMLTNRDKSSIARFFVALKIKRDEEKYDSWLSFKQLHEQNDSPVYSYYFAQATSESNILPSNYKQKYSIPVINELIDKFPKYIKPRLDFYDYTYFQNRYSQALKILEEILKIDFNNKKVWKEKIFFYENRSWVAQKHLAIIKAAEIFPDDVEFQLMKIRVLKIHNNFAEALTLYENLINRLPTVSNTYFIWKKYLDSSKISGELFGKLYEKWLKIIKLFENRNTTAIEDYCEFLIEHGKCKEALNYIMNVFSTKPSSGYAKKISEIYFLIKDDANAFKYLKKSLKLNHNKNCAEKQYLKHLQNNSDYESYKKYSIPVSTVLKIETKPSDYPDSTSVLLLDEEVKRIFPDGSSTSIITTVRRILTQEGTEEYGTVRIPGELINAQVVKSNGEIIEPSFAGKTVNFQGIEIGSTQIIISQENSEEFNSLFYFSDPEGKEHFLTSRIVILKSKKLDDFKIDEKLIEIKEKSENSEYDIYVYELKNSSPVPEEEDYAPGIADYLPHISLKNKFITPQNPHFHLLEKEEKFNETSLIAQKAQQLTKKLSATFDKAKAIYEFVAKEIKNDYFIENPTEILLHGSGNCENLLLSLFHAAKINFDKISILTPEAFFVLRITKDVESFSLTDFIDAIRIKTENKYIYLIIDSRSMKYIPFAYMPYSGALGFTFENKINFFIIDESNNSDNLIEKSVFDVRLVDKKTIADGKIILKLDDSNIIKNYLPQLSNTQKKQLITQLIQEKTNKLLVSEFSINNKINSKPVTINIKGRFTNSIRAISNDRLEISMCLKPLELMKKYTPSPTRRTKMKIVEFQYSNSVDTRIINIPNNYLVLNAPVTSFYFTKGFIYLLDVTRYKDKIMIKRKWMTFPAIYETDEYNNLKQYCKAIDTLESSNITLLKIAEISKKAKKEMQPDKGE